MSYLQPNNSLHLMTTRLCEVESARAVSNSRVQSQLRSVADELEAVRRIDNRKDH